MTRPGPKTAEGKATVRLNAVQHGIYSDTPVLAGLESEEEWQLHLQGIMESYAPQGQLETELAERVAILMWRLQRVVRYERQAIEIGQERIAEDHARNRYPFASRSTDLLAQHPDLDPDLLTRKAAAAEWKFRTIERFPDRPDKESLTARAAVVVVSAVLELARTIEPGLHYKTSSLRSQDSWRVADIRRLLSDIAEPAKVDVSELLAAAKDEAEQVFKERRAKADRVALRLDRMSRERLLPDQRAVDKVIRYEAHLHRQLLQTMHELEALQHRRRGAITPLARLDIVEGGEATQATHK